MKLNTKISIIGNLGILLEYYDYVIFILLTPYFALLFFPDQNENINVTVISIITLTSLSSWARIIGAIFFTTLNRKISEQKILIISIFLMSVSTFLIGTLPTYSKIGIYSGILLIFLRFLQGISYSAELPNTTTMLSNHDNPASQISFIIASTTLGAVMANYVMFILTKNLSNEKILEYGWRIPLLFGGIIGIIGYLLRRNIKDSYYIPSEGKFRINFYKLIFSTSLILLPAVLIVENMYFPTMLNKFYDYTLKDCHFYSTIGLLSSIICSIFCGRIIKKHNYKRIFLFSCLFFLIFYPVNIEILKIGHQFCLLYFFVVHQIFLTIFMNLSLYIITQKILTKKSKIFMLLSYNSAFIFGSLGANLVNIFENFYLTWYIPSIIIIFNITLFIIKVVLEKRKDPNSCET